VHAVARRDPSPDDLLAQALAGQRSSLARLLSLVERGGEPARAIGRRTHAMGGAAYTVGLTGAPGAGKSTLTSAVLSVFRGDDERVAVLAIDPSSPFTGGAILGDRVRMGDHVLDEGVFIRSMATRGHLGGLSLAAPEAVRVLDAVGYPWVLIETVGVGQVEVEVAGEADTTVVVVNPGWGDAVQANKAGLMEIADIFVVNKADRPGAADTRRDLEQMMDLSSLGGWRPPVVETVADRGDGVADLVEAVRTHRSHLETTGELAVRRQARLTAELQRILAERLLARARAVAETPSFEGVVADVVARKVDPWTATDHLLGED